MNREQKGHVYYIHIIHNVNIKSLSITIQFKTSSLLDKY